MEIISDAMITMKTKPFLGSCPVKFKLQVIDAVIRSKVLYGMDTAQINETEATKLETSQLKVLRNILNMKTTFINRNNTNETVYREANSKIAEISPTNPKDIIPFKLAYQKQKTAKTDKYTYRRRRHSRQTNISERHNNMEIPKQKKRNTKI